MVYLATETVFAPGVFVTTISYATSKSTLSHPTPNREITRNLFVRS